MQDVPWRRRLAGRVDVGRSGPPDWRSSHQDSPAGLTLLRYMGKLRRRRVCLCDRAMGCVHTSVCARFHTKISGLGLTKSSVDHPTSVMSPLFQGLTCIPSSLSGTCTLGGYPSYAVNISNVSPPCLCGVETRIQNCSITNY